MARKKKQKEPVLPSLVEDGNHKNRLKVGQEVFCYDGKSMMEKVTVVDVDKKSKVATLSNQVKCSRYPDSEGFYRKEGVDTLSYKIKKWDEDTAALYKASTSRKQLINYISTIKSKYLDLNLDNLSKEDWDTMNKLANLISQVL